MKTSMKILAVVAVLAISLTVTSAVFAKGGPGNGGNVTPGTGVVGTKLEVVLSDYMPAAIADTLDMSVEDVNNLLASGETCYTIALSKGYTVDQVAALMDSVRAAAIDLAEADGALSAEQVEWLQTNQNSYGYMSYNYQSQSGTGLCDGTCIPVGSASMNRRGRSH